MAKPRARARCDWAGTESIYVDYHDQEWGVPVTDDRTLFEFLLLEGAQAGLSWLTVLRKREGYRQAFANFDAAKVARFTDRRLALLAADPNIVRNRAKIASAVTNARAFLRIQKEFGSFAHYQWRFVDGRPIHNGWTRLDQIPARSDLSDQFSKDLKQRGFSFVGSTIIYAHMQAVGMVNDHLTSCFRHEPVRKLGRRAVI